MNESVNSAVTKAQKIKKQYYDDFGVKDFVNESLTDLRHFCDRHGISFQEMVEKSERYAQSDKEEG